MRRKFKWSSKLLPKQNRKPEASAGKQISPELSKIQKNIYRQAMLAGLTIVLTIVILFAMTSAWYTNIVQTSGLVFEAEPWGFDGTITVENDPIQAAPGDEGVISMVVQNASESLSTLSVNISKADMTEQEMQKRLFFYVDTHMTREGETMDRVYINNFEGYNYTVFGKGQLTLTEEISNAPQIKWQWVYDMLGYYFMGNPIKDASGNITIMSVQDYLRPIEYNYDEATIVFSTDSDGHETASITTMDGKSVKDFLVSVSEKDGYPGKIDTTKAVTDAADRVYYPVDVDASGSGVYAYLCTYSDVELATDYDTNLGRIAHKKVQLEAKDETLPPEELNKIRHEATISISAQNSDSTVASVGTLTALNNAIAAGNADVIQLSSGITLTEANPLVIPANTRTTIDLNGNTITGTNANGASIVASQGSSLTLTNGIITGENSRNGKGKGIEATGAEVIMSDIKMSGFDNGVYMGDHNKVDGKENELDSRVHMVNCTINANWYGVYINGNGTNSDQKTQLIIENSTISGDGYGITGSGNTNRCGTDIQIFKSTILQKPANGGTGAAIFQPQKDSTLTIRESTIEGYTGIALKGGYANIFDAEIIGYGVQHEDPKTYATQSGFADTADAVYIETNYGYDISLKITNSTLTHTGGTAEAQSLRVYEEDAANVTIEIVSGTFDQAQNAKYLAEGSTQKQDNKLYVVTAAN